MKLLQTKFIDQFLILFSIIISKSLYYETYGENYLLLIVLFLMLIYFTIRWKKNESIISIFNILMIVIISISIVINPNAIYSTFLVFFTCQVISFLFVSTISIFTYANSFYNIVKILIVISFFRYLFIYFKIASPFPNFISINGDQFENFIFFGILSKKETVLGILRNNGLWWEPGAFQIIINIAFLFGIILNNSTVRL